MKTSNGWNPDVNLDGTACVAVLAAAVLSILIGAATTYGDKASPGEQVTQAQKVTIANRVVECPHLVLPSVVRVARKLQLAM